MRHRKVQRPERSSVRVGHDTFDFGYTSDRYTVRWNGSRYADGDMITKVDNVVIMKVRNHPDGNRCPTPAPVRHGRQGWRNDLPGR